VRFSTRERKQRVRFELMGLDDVGAERRQQIRDPVEHVPVHARPFVDDVDGNPLCAGCGGERGETLTVR
jgi:hypothetical protein